MDDLTTGYPVPARPIMRFRWHAGDWFEIFERHVALIQSDIARAQAEDRIVVYLSCPISSRGGGHFGTNIEIANFVARRLASQWGERFFVVNPAAYQLESKEGTGLIVRHIADLARETGRELTLDGLRAQAEPGGGDYMRMWTRVLVEDGYLADPPGRSRSGRHLGGLFDAYYFLGPDDMHEFFGAGGRTSGGRTGGGSADGGTLASKVEEYFARKYAIDPEFFVSFAAGPDSDGATRLLDLTNPSDARLWEARRKEFVRYYTVRAGAAYSLGSHDEWNLMARLNRARVADPAYGPGEQIAAYFAAGPCGLAEAEAETSIGYEVAAVPVSPNGMPATAGQRAAEVDA
ncbi:hypothetical protein [Cryptosporangium aurantiacum]|uniref:Uncharacterized protein n=1 Tax=Cryptosporangium aurantiacum TaxID=134849 RepID=A0A1M7R2C2_9ACTN|nr:hypothetical protein [Cryptosporangium aurantiacum]SHN38877.1 hypothetical protein SAMN05443668_106154 [Cryptosporangium aurantiacum]